MTTLTANSGPADATLWRAAVAGDSDAFGALFDRHATAVYNYVLRRTADWSVAEDLTAAVFLQAWRRRSEVEFAADSALPWLLGVARLQLRNAHRARARYLAAVGRAGAEAVTQTGPADPADLVAGRLDGERQLASLRAAIAALPRQQREVVELCVYAGLGQQEAAIALGISPGTVRSRLHRARHRLATQLQAASVATAGQLGEGR